MEECHDSTAGKDRSREHRAGDDQGGTTVQVTKPEQARSAVIERAPRALTTPEWSTPFSAMRRMMDDMERLLSGFSFGIPSLSSALSPFETTSQWVPAIETFERDGNLVLRTDLPGLRREDVHVEILGDELVVSGERKEETEETRAGRRYSERRYGSFERRIALPVGVDTKSIDASFDSGVLEISVAAPPGRESRKIEVKSRSTGQESGEQKGSIH
jgi:HSP20 family protein